MKWIPIFMAAWLLLIRPAVYGWSQPGHMIIAAMAYDELSEGDRTKLDAILRNHVKYETWAAEYPANGLSDLTKEKFVAMLASLYPDEIRNYHNPETFGYWHFADYPLCPPDFPMKLRPLPGNDVVSGITDSEDAVAKLDKPADAATRAKMLSYLIHLVGDIHQPLHCANWFDTRFPDGDKGGNKAFVRPPGEAPMRLHAYWDQLFGPGAPALHAPPVTMILAADHLAIDLAQRFQRADLPELSTHLTPEEWSLESRESAIKDVWLSSKLACSADESNAPELPADYRDNAHQVAEHRAALAGHRLADRLHAILR